MKNPLVYFDSFQTRKHLICGIDTNQDITRLGSIANVARSIYPPGQQIANEMSDCDLAG